ncbi:hypothetical protein [Prosthecobacter sp.]|uniref:hypothetical protein n=1 Tax=Prosthecobacter sp. TaxID=1965333 RepID=UPI0037849082
MKTLLFFLLIAATALVFRTHGIIAASVLFMFGGYLITPWSAMKGQLCVTLTPTEILALQIKSFKKRVPVLQMMGTDFTGMSLRYNQNAIARIRTLGTASTYSANSGGYKNGAQSGRGLLTDVPLVLDQWVTYPILLEHINHIQDAINDYTGVVGDGGYIIGKGMVDYILGLVSSARFSQGQTIATADFDVDGLIAVNKSMNAVTEANDRFMIVNSDVASTLAADQRLINSQWFGEKQGGEPIRVWRNAYGFREIREYVDLPAGTTPALTGVTCTDTGDIFTKTAHGLVTGQRVTAASFSAGFSNSGKLYVIKVSADTFQLASSLANAVAGTALTVSADGTGGVVTGAENMCAFAFEQRAFAVHGGAPAPVTTELAAQFGIPVSTLVDAMYDSETQIAMGQARWQEPGTADLYICPTMIYGAKVGRNVGTAAGSGLDYAGHIIRTA